MANQEESQNKRENRDENRNVNIDQNSPEILTKRILPSLICLFVLLKMLVYKLDLLKFLVNFGLY